MIKADERAPEFTLPDETGKDRSLTELLSAGAMVLYFYPADFTPGCTRQACVLRDLHSEIERRGVAGGRHQPPAARKPMPSSRPSISCRSFCCRINRKPS